MSFAAFIPLLGSIIDRIIPDPEKAAEAKLKALELAQSGELAKLNADTSLALGQIEVNKIEAASDSLFKSGWRPGAGWCCVAGLFYQAIGAPIAGWIASNLHGWTPPPSLDTDTLMALLFGLLGLGGYRTFERMKGAKK